jgi:GDP-L-fucose synthase
MQIYVKETLLKYFNVFVYLFLFIFLIKMKKEIILVTGGTGLVGNGIKMNIPQDQLDNYIFLSSRDGDLRDYTQAKQIFEKYKPDKVIHLAAKVGGLFTNMKHTADFYYENNLINTNVIHLSKIYNVKKLVSCLSTCIFPDKTSYPINETMLHNGLSHNSNLGYGMVKRMIDIQNRVYNDQYGCQFTSIIPTNVYGKFDNFDLQESHLIPALIRKCYEAKRDNKPFIVMGTGTPLRQFIDSRDLGKLILWVLSDYPEIEPIILSVSESQEVTIKYVADTIKKCMDYPNDITWDNDKADGQFKKTACNDKLIKYLPDFKFRDFEKSIQETVDWFIQNYDEIIK